MNNPRRPSWIGFAAFGLILSPFPVTAAIVQELPTAVEGIVYEDYNGNGQRDRGEGPVAGIRIAVLDGPSGAQLTTRAGADIEIRSDARGRYRYESTGHLDLRLRPFDPAASTMYNPRGWLETNPIERRVRTNNGSVASGVDIGYMQARTTAVEGLVFDDSDRDGRQGSGERPMAGVRFAVLDGPTGQQLLTRNGADIEVRADSRGRYRYETQGSIDVRLRPFDPAKVTTDNRRGWLEAKPRERRVQVKNGNVVTDADFAIEGNLTTVVEGVVFDDLDGDGRRDTNEPGIGGVRIVVLDGPTGNFLLTVDGATVETQTDAQGRFRFAKTGILDIRLRPWDPSIRSTTNRNGWLSTTPAERRLQVPNGGVASDADFAY